ncbi:MAG: cytochrome C biogenesis protein CycH, partial [Flavobacteriales bacterium]
MVAKCDHLSTNMNQRGEIIIYQTGSGKTDIKIRLDKKTLWLDQYQMTELFETDRTSIGRHIRNIYQSSELKESSTCAKITQVQKEGNRTVQRQIKAYNMDVIIS